MVPCDRFFVNVDTLSLGRGNKGEGFFPAALGRRANARPAWKGRRTGRRVLRYTLRKGTVLTVPLTRPKILTFPLSRREWGWG